MPPLWAEVKGTQNAYNTSKHINRKGFIAHTTKDNMLPKPLLNNGNNNIYYMPNIYSDLWSSRKEGNVNWPGSIPNDRSALLRARISRPRNAL